MTWFLAADNFGFVWLYLGEGQKKRAVGDFFDIFAIKNLKKIVKYSFCSCTYFLHGFQKKFSMYGKNEPIDWSPLLWFPPWGHHNFRSGIWNPNPMVRTVFCTHKRTWGKLLRKVRHFFYFENSLTTVVSLFHFHRSNSKYLKFSGNNEIFKN